MNSIHAEAKASSRAGGLRLVVNHPDEGLAVYMPAQAARDRLTVIAAYQDGKPVTRTIMLNETQDIDPDHPDGSRERDLLKAVLLFHSGDPWDAKRQAEWLRLVGTRDASTKTLCDAIRRVLS